MADAVLLLLTELGIGAIVTFGSEDWVVAEALPSVTSQGNLSVGTSLEEVCPELIDQCNDGAARGSGMPERRSSSRATFSAGVACGPAKRAE